MKGRFLFLLGLLLAAIRLAAHGPYESSGRFILRDDSLELMLVLGGEAAAQVLHDAPKEALQNHGPSGGYELPVDQARRIGQLSAAGRDWPATKLSVHGDGLEVAFVVVYPRPASGPLAFAPAFHQGIDQVAATPVVFTDENGNRLGGGTLARDGSAFILPFVDSVGASAAAVNADSGVEVTSVPTVAPPAEPSAPKDAPVATSGRSGGPLGWIVLIGVICAGIGLARRFLKP